MSSKPWTGQPMAGAEPPPGSGRGSMGAGPLGGNQLAVAAVTLTLFLPCIAQFLIMKKERGLKLTLLVSAFICVFAFVVGFLLNLTLSATGVRL